MAGDFEIGVIGLGVMGRNLAFNLADHGYPVAGYDKDPAKVEALHQERRDQPVQGAATMEEFVAMLRPPRAALLLVPAGEPVDAVIRELLPRLQEGDLIIDGGNSFFRDTDRRMSEIHGKGIHYLGMGISGGEYGARHGPSMMPGGSRDGYKRVRVMLEQAAAQVDGKPCVAYLGPGSAGHYVKLVHNGIEYGIMELIAESYDLMKRGMGLDNDRIHTVFDGWNQGELNGYLMEITAQIFCRGDELGKGRLIDEVRDEAKQKGTGKWASQDAMDLGVPLPTIDTAVAMRHLSTYKEEREKAARALPGPEPRLSGARAAALEHLEGALYAGVILTFAQGMSLLQAASTRYAYNLDLETVARIWRGGCIIRAALLERIRAAYARDTHLANLALDPELGRILEGRAESLRRVVGLAAEAGVPAPGLMSALGYLDALRSAHLPDNLIQAQRDFFGAHTYERIDREGVFHTQWSRR